MNFQSSLFYAIRKVERMKSTMLFAKGLLIQICETLKNGYYPYCYFLKGVSSFHYAEPKHQSILSLVRLLFGVGLLMPRDGIIRRNFNQNDEGMEIISFLRDIFVRDLLHFMLNFYSLKKNFSNIIRLQMERMEFLRTSLGLNFLREYVS